MVHVDPVLRTPPLNLEYQAAPFAHDCGVPHVDPAHARHSTNVLREDVCEIPTDRCTASGHPKNAAFEFEGSEPRYLHKASVERFVPVRKPGFGECTPAGRQLDPKTAGHVRVKKVPIGARQCAVQSLRRGVPKSPIETSARLVKKEVHIKTEQPPIDMSDERMELEKRRV